VPLDTVTNLQVNFGMDFYTSASSDQIDFNVSGASKSDTRTHLNIGLNRTNKSRRTIKGISIGGSTEYDYQSLSAGVNWAKSSVDGNRELSLGALAYFDSWSLIYPIELRDRGELLPENKRRSYSVSGTLSQVINRKMQASLSSDIVYQAGLLSTPFHRVYFTDQELPDIERLPDTRYKYPVGIRFNYYASDFMTMRIFYRFYTDSWGMTANTMELETPIKIGPFFSFYPFYRYHTQTAVDYFAPYKEHVSTETYYTSDYDLAGINSHKAGLGVRYSPLEGIARFGLPFTKNGTRFKSIEVRAGNYWRSDGLEAFIISTDLSFTLPAYLGSR
jgi:hypothetical protein